MAGRHFPPHTAAEGWKGILISHPVAVPSGILKEVGVGVSFD